MNFEIPNYTLLKRLGEGAMAEVWLARHQRNGRMAAIKVLKPTALSDKDAETLFLREGEVLAGFDHKNIVKIYDNNRIGDLAFIIMEHLSGGTLQERMQRGPIQVGESLGLVAQIAGALEIAHKQQVIHRDLKPANVMLRDETTPVLTDFGAVRMLDRSTIYGRDGGVIGTPTYMSPEQITGQTLTGSSDLYALGIMFHEMLTGTLPFPGGSIQEVASQHLYAEVPQLPEPLSMLQPVLEQLLAKKPEWRYPDAAQFIDALRATFLSSEALRLQVGFSGTSMAWSSQLRAMGFSLDSAQKSEVRRAQGEYLEAHSESQQEPTVKVRNRSGIERESEAEPAQVSPDPARVGDSNSSQASDRGPAVTSRAVLWLVLIAIGVALTGGGIFLAVSPSKPTPEAAPSVAKPGVNASAVVAARESYLLSADLLQELGAREKRDVQSTLKASVILAKKGESAFNQGRLDDAYKEYGAARDRIRADALTLLDVLEQDYARVAQSTLNDGQLAEAQQLLELAKQARAQRQEWVIQAAMLDAREATKQVVDSQGAYGGTTDGQAIYLQLCQACHDPGVAGSPRINDKAAWAPRVAEGLDTLVKHAIEGYIGSSGFHPPRGGNPDLTDEQVRATVEWMLTQVK